MAIKTKSTYIDIITHQLNQRPKLFRVSKLALNTFLYFIPALFLFSIISLLLIGVYFQEIKINTVKKESAALSQIKKEKKELETKIINIRAENIILQKKLLTPTADSLAITLGLFTPIPGQKDLSGQGKSQIDNFVIKRSENILSFNFNITNLTNGKEKLSGYIFGVAKSKNALYVYPEDALSNDKIHLSFNQGESFGTYRFRPSTIKFSIPNNIPIDIYEIFIFSRTGDLLAKRVYSPSQEVR